MKVAVVRPSAPKAQRASTPSGAKLVPIIRTSVGVAARPAGGYSVDSEGSSAAS